jgi:membrane protein YdbS with pleckstrin-like domain
MVSETPVADPNGMFGERIVAKLRRHGGSMLWPALALIVLSSAAGFASGFLTELWMQILLWSVFVVLVIVLVVVPWLRWLASVVTITTHRIMIVDGLFVRSRREILLLRVQDIAVRRSPGQMLFGSGDVLIGVGAEKPVRIHGLPRPNLVLAALTELMHGVAPRTR